MTRSISGLQHALTTRTKRTAQCRVYDSAVVVNLAAYDVGLVADVPTGTELTCSTAEAVTPGRRLTCICLVAGSLVVAHGKTPSPRPSAPNVSLVNGRWFDGKTFEPRAVYSVDGRFTTKRPARVDRQLDLQDTWVVPPFGEAHNHNLTISGIERDRETVRRYMEDGVFYVKLSGEPAARRRRTAAVPELSGRSRRVRRPGFSDGHRRTSYSAGRERAVPQGFFPGHTKESLKNMRYFTIHSEAELEQKWPRILGLHPDFIKTFLVFSERRRDDPSYVGQRGLDPRLLPGIVAKAHAMN